MAKLFYDHLILLDEILMEIDILDLPVHKKTKGKKIIDEIVHHKVLIYILDYLPKVHHREFLERLYQNPADLAHLTFLQEKTERDIQMDLVVLGKKIKKEILAEIKKHKK
ncbi:MAG: hypothetical protein US50_C0057G0003 [Candidatus Nomurabacteria bacterium GW2011_GWB1_37_5]|uniref:Uncharacterized protein n=1 Tax=Candidatus Nomurabacteria bacterium GW2011_GWB1_37_5 TaxID=1618742 RepID=A0A0G0GT28_9BACT|nr:MAG: hypothetical protein US50_C0057G0003 [Candidatus Nomurabacteria bacterium GW2011_GWB1_37_5]